MDHTLLSTNYTIGLPASIFPASSDGATTDCSSRHLIAAYYSFINLERMKGWAGLVGWPTADGLPTVYSHKWSPVSCRSTAGQGKFAGQRPIFYHSATQSGIQESFSMMSARCWHNCGHTWNVRCRRERGTSWRRWRGRTATDRRWAHWSAVSYPRTLTSSTTDQLHLALSTAAASHNNIPDTDSGFPRRHQQHSANLTRLTVSKKLHFCFCQTSSNFHEL